MKTYLLLSVGSDPELLKIRTLILLDGGYAVRTAVSADEAIEVFKGSDFDAVVICHSIPERERLKLISAVREARPSAKVIVVRRDGELSAQVADETVHSLDGAERLLGTVREALSN